MNLTIPNGVEHGLGTGIVRPLQSLCDNCRFQVVAALYERRSYSKIKTGGHRPPLQPQLSHRLSRAEGSMGPGLYRGFSPTALHLSPLQGARGNRARGRHYQRPY